MYICRKCGRCCRKIGGHPLYAELDDGEGVCVFLDRAANLCTIYENRPLQCRVNDAFAVYFSEIMSAEEYEDLNRRACRLLREQEE